MPDILTLLNNDNPTLPVIVAAPHAGGSAPAHRGWAQELSGVATVYGATPPGRGRRLFDEPLDTVAALAAELRAAITVAIPAARPLYLLGHSLGALVAYEAARTLQLLRPIAGLIVIGRSAPHLPAADTSRWSDLPEAQFITALHTLGGFDDTLLDEPELLELVLPALRADVSAAENYRWQPGLSLECPLTVITGDSDAAASADRCASWSLHAVAPAAVHVVAGAGHFPHQDQCAATAALIAEALT